MKRAALARYRPWQDEFDRRYACWAVNHGGWCKMIKQNRRTAKRKMYKEL